MDAVAQLSAAGPVPAADAVHLSRAESPDARGVAIAVDRLPAPTPSKENVHPIRVEPPGSPATGLTVLREVMGALRELHAGADLVTWAVEMITRLGFDRALVSAVDGHTWTPLAAHDPLDQKWADDILALGRAAPRPFTNGLVESEVVRTRRGKLVRDAQRLDEPHPEMIRAARTESYTVVPLATADTVIGLLHADCYYQRRDPTPLEETILTLFAEGLSQALRQARLVDDLEAARAQLVHLSQLIGDTAPGLTGRPPTTSPRSVSSIHDALAASSATDQRHTPRLTRREIEVLNLLAAGYTNGRIARRLVVAEGTIKTHVKHILRKLGVENRAGAVARWLEYEQRLVST
jgi:DNA-binding CsgD family transcriptional regulator